MKALKWINTFAFAAMIAVNALANFIPIGGNTTGQVSEAYPNLFTPAPLTFAIWGAIYLLLAVFVLYQWEIFDRGQYSAVIRQRVGLWFAVSCALNIAWIFCWHYRAIGLSLATIFMLLLSLTVICFQVGGADGNFFRRMAAKSGFSLYLGWIIAASIANLGVFLTKSGWNGWGISPDIWTIAALIVGALITSAVVFIRQDRIAAIAVMWAYAGILYRHMSPTYLGGSHPFVISAAFLGEALILGSLVIPAFSRSLVEKQYIG